MPKLSIIVPVYKVEQYLHKCIDSILSQTFTDFELILIDDGSPDRCGKICDEYAAKDDRIIVIHQKNQGVSAARNAGLDIARGEYIGFVDSDDWIEPIMYESMLLDTYKEFDIVTVGAKSYEDNNVRVILAIDSVFDQEELLSELIAQPNRIGGGVVNKIFKKSILKNVRFPAGITMCEDRLFLFDAYSNAGSCRSLPLPMYSIVARKGSSLRTNTVEPLYAIVHGDKLLLRMYRKHRQNMLPYAIDKYMQECMYYITAIRKLGTRNKIPYKKYILFIKASMAAELIRGISKGLVTRTKCHSYAMGLLKR